MRKPVRIGLAVFGAVLLAAAFQNCGHFSASPGGIGLSSTSTSSSSGADEGSSTPAPQPQPSPVATPSPAPVVTTPSPAPQPAPQPAPLPASVDLIGDPLLKTGFRETDACPNVSDTITAAGCANNVERDVHNPLYPASAGQTPKWSMQQWGSRTSLPGGSGVAYGDGIKWADANKSFAVFPSGVFEMGINGYNDWNGKYRQAQPERPGWPSLTLGYNITNPGNVSTSPSGNVTTIKSLQFSMDAYLTMEDRHQQAGYDPAQNSVIFVGYVGVQNLTAGSAGYGQFIWMGIPIYNDLEDRPAPYVNVDTFGDGLGTGMLIYSPGFSAYSQTSLHSLQWVHLASDMMPNIKAALSRGITGGNLADADISHYYISGLNIGYEVTGLNETRIQFKNVSLVANH